jgi:tRNA (adenine57-N1/adenine58-N1)-methyltransferase catalytic subunit
VECPSAAGAGRPDSGPAGQPVNRSSDERFAPGELALLIDAHAKHHLVRLEQGATFHHHLGAVPHDAIIGQPDGVVVRSGRGQRVVAVRPRLVDYVLAMPRRSGIVYPKDAALIVAWADVRRGARVLESGVGSGALTLALLRAVGEGGSVIGYEQRPDFIELALANVRAFAHGPTGNLLVRERDVYAGIVDGDLDQVVLDLPEPWRVVPHLPRALRQGGWLCAYTPSIVQAAQLVEALRAAGRYAQVSTHEVLLRSWHVKGQAVRPDQQMVGHTGFVTVGRLVAEGGPSW